MPPNTTAQSAGAAVASSGRRPRPAVSPPRPKGGHSAAAVSPRVKIPMNTKEQSAGATAVGASGPWRPRPASIVTTPSQHSITNKISTTVAATNAIRNISEDVIQSPRTPLVLVRRNISESTPKTPRGAENPSEPASAAWGVTRLRNLVFSRKAQIPSSSASSAATNVLVGGTPAGGAAARRKAMMSQLMDGAAEEEVHSEDSVHALKLTKAIGEWTHTTRPEIRREELISDSTLDDRHSSRRVKCVGWHPRGIRTSEKGEGAERSGPQKEKFALKICLRGKLDVHSRRVFNEKDIMVALGDNQWHTRLVNAFKSDTNLYMLLEYAPLLSLDQHIDWGQGLRRGGQQAVVFYAACVLSALEYMHNLGIAHRDIKPGNMLLASDGYVKLCDYGLSKFLKRGDTTTTMLGTLAYIPPEQVNGEPYGHATDMWSLGISCYEMCYGATPFEPGGIVSNAEWVEQTKKCIRRAQLRLPVQGASLPMRLFLKVLLARQPAERLGCSSDKGLSRGVDYDKIRSHPVFTKFDWHALAERRALAPVAGSLLTRA
eukprot:CAMPEP_0171927148 /NCGR_PEP_ID=MMETSP0993-20121228/25525_1 /TAXON_ID=483369 /ORGANISM="non described non described, Strain CCMP2098" /LENGTH=544 /DNA_ID=CAMNT_0012566127 /DNA_START=41 /DNA_END=1675 /DNA_ORIENTATION=+